MERSTRVLLVDLSNVTYRAVCSHAGLSHDGVQTGGVFGFLQIVCKLVNDHQATHIVVADDSKPYLRAELFPRYKGDRSSIRTAATPEVRGYVSDAKAQISEVLKQVGASIARVPGYEADDIIAKACARPSASQYVIGSNDSDLYQCLQPEGFVSLCRKGGLYTYEHFRAEYGLNPDEWPRVLALAGSHNGVPGISGVGLKTAAKLVLQRATCRHVAYKYRVSVEEQRLRERLATYPWRGLPIIEGQKIRYERRRMTAWLSRRFGIEFAPYMHTAFDSLS